MDDHLSWLVLLNAPQLGSQCLLSLLETFGTAGNILAATDTELRRAEISPRVLRSLRQEPSPLIEQQQSWLQQPGHRMITCTDEAYPPLLREIHDPPAALFVKGDADTLKCPQFAIVGSRNPSQAGRKIAQFFASQLAETGFVINSGMALGIDYCAHDGALTSGKTIAVLGCGPDIMYPARHRQLAESIVKGGALVSEFPPGTPPLASNFPRRNRIISGLSVAVLVVEATINSGSLITARCAMEQGREVFAIPGPVQSALSRGCHCLIKEGAKLVESIVDVLEELHLEEVPLFAEGWHESVEAGRGKSGAESDEYRLLLDYLSHSPQTMDDLIEMSGLTAETVSSILLIMEVQGIISSVGGHYTKIN